MQKSFCFMIIFLVLGSVSSHAATRIFLVPGTFNSLLGQYYFYGKIRSQFQKEGFDVVDVNTLSPLGGYRRNGRILEKTFTQNCGSEENWIVAHSAGGLYALAALAKSTCRFTGLVTVGSPLTGVVLAKKIYATPFGRLFRWVLPWIWFDVSVFDDYLPDRMQAFYKELTPLPYAFKFFTYAGAQLRPTGLTQQWNARYQMPHLSFFSRYFDGPNDGLVAVDSALGVGLSFKTKEKGMVIPQKGAPAFDLDHVELFQDVALVNLLHSETAQIQENQDRLYQDIIIKIKETIRSR